MRLYRHRHEGRNQGGALLICALVVIAVLGLCSALISLSLAEARSVRETTDHYQALVLAEAGLEGLKYEIGMAQDADGDGLDTRTRTFVSGTYTATGIETSPDVWELTSIGMVGSQSRTVQLTIAGGTTTEFSTGGLTVVGPTDPARFFFRKHDDLLLCGGVSAAMEFTDSAAVQAIGQSFAEAFDAGTMSAGGVSGGITQDFIVSAGGNDTVYPVSITENAQPSSALADLDPLYDALVSQVTTNLRPTYPAFPAPSGTSPYVYGSTISPVNYVADSLVVAGGDVIQGHGTLIVRSLEIKEGSRIDWDGNIIVLGDSVGVGQVTIYDTGSELAVDGNLVVLGEGTGQLDFTVESNARVEVDGSFFVGTDYTLGSGQNVHLNVKDTGSLDVEGLMTVVGNRFDLALDIGSDVDITGSLQFALPSDDSNHTMNFSANGNLAVCRDEAGIRLGASKWDDLGGDIVVPETSTLVSDTDVIVRDWKRTQ